MRVVTLGFVGFFTLAPRAITAQGVLFNFDNAPLHTPLPITLTVGGITAHFSGTGQGFSIQPANSLGFTPAGFSGNCIYPDSVFATDLLVSFSPALTAFSILYSPQELGCDSSATMRVTGFMDGVLVGTATTNASSPGTWPSEILALNSAQNFNSVVVHYDSPPACQDWGPIFLADNMLVTPAPPPLLLTNASIVPSGAFQFSWTAQSGTSFSILATTNISQPQSYWTVLGGVTEPSPGYFQFTDPQPAIDCSRFYRVRSP
jgi:hypothetical protein